MHSGGPIPLAFYSVFHCIRFCIRFCIPSFGGAGAPGIHVRGSSCLRQNKHAGRKTASFHLHFYISTSLHLCIYIYIYIYSLSHLYSAHCTCPNTDLRDVQIHLNCGGPASVLFWRPLFASPESSTGFFFLSVLLFLAYITACRLARQTCTARSGLNAAFVPTATDSIDRPASRPMSTITL